MRTVVLTKEFFKINSVTYKDAIPTLLNGRACPVHEYTIFSSLDEWFAYAKTQDSMCGRVVHSQYLSFYVPTHMIHLNSTMPIHSTPKPTRRNIWIRDGKKCAYCGVPLAYDKATVDHVFPSSKGGKTKWNNVVISCASCNNSKSDTYLNDLPMQLRIIPRAPSWMELINKNNTFGFV